jgi:hypothetical protein
MGGYALSRFGCQKVLCARQISCLSSPKNLLPLTVWKSVKPGKSSLTRERCCPHGGAPLQGVITFSFVSRLYFCFCADSGTIRGGPKSCADSDSMYIRVGGFCAHSICINIYRHPPHPPCMHTHLRVSEVPVIEGFGLLAGVHDGENWESELLAVATEAQRHGHCLVGDTSLLHTHTHTHTHIQQPHQTHASYKRTYNT